MNSIYMKPSGRKYYILIFIMFVAFSAAAWIIGDFFHFSPWQPMFFLLVLTFIGWGAAFLYFQQQYIHAEDDIITVKQGIINSKITVIPFNKINEVSTEYELVDKLLGLGTVSIDTAGTDKQEIIVKNVPAQSIISFLALFRQHRKKGMPSNQAPAQEQYTERDSW